jgi:integrase/recombinase XerC
MDKIKVYLEYLKYTKRYSDHTISAYRLDLGQFNAFLQEQAEQQTLIGAGHKDIRNWVISLIGQKDTPRSVNRKITSLRSFYKFLLMQGEIASNPVLKVTPLKVEKNLPNFVKEGQIQFLFDDIEFGMGYENLRNKIILELFYLTGMRLSELVNLKDHDIDLYSHSVKVTGKRDKQRVIPLSKGFIEKIRDYMAQKNELFANVHLFVTSKGQKAYPKLVYRLVNRYLSLVSTQKKKSPHVLRHTFATHMLNNGADINAIKEILGHANLAATEVYTHISFERLKSIYKQAHPRAIITEDLL